jgi:foldase protein PrsA
MSKLLNRKGNFKMLLNNRRSAWRRLPLLAVVLTLVVTMAAACGGGSKKNGGGDMPGAGEGQAVATYKDGGKVSQKEFDKYITMLEITNPQTAMYLYIDPTFKESELKRYITFKEFAKKATDDDKKIAKEQSESFVGQLEEALKGESATDLQGLMDKSGLTSAEAGKFVDLLVQAQEVVERKRQGYMAEVKDEAIKAEFDKAPANYNIVSVRHILVGTADASTGEELRTEEEALKRAEEAKAKLDAGGDWAALAKEYSDDPGSKEVGGLYEDKEAGGWVEEFKEAANTQAIGVIGKPVKTSYGYHVMKVEKREEMTYDKLSEAKKSTIRETLANPKLNEYMTAEQDKLEIKVDLPKEEAPAGEETPAEGAGNDAGEQAGNDAEVGTEGDAAKK